MATREEYLTLLWKDAINAPLKGHWIDNVLRDGQRWPNSPFADIAPILKRLLDLGATRRELSLLSRFAAYEAVFSALYSLSDPGIEANDVEMLHESLLGADPSGLEGRPGSAPEQT